jgi:hypothetical protein
MKGAQVVEGRRRQARCGVVRGLSGMGWGCALAVSPSAPKPASNARWL